MRTFEAKHAQALAAAVTARADGDTASAKLFADRAQMWAGLDADVLERKARGQGGAHRA